MSKTVWITGASSGIGKALALQYGAEKWNVVLSARSVDKLRDVQSEVLRLGGKAAIITLDLSQSNSLKQKSSEAWAIYQGIDVLINNGGISQRSEWIHTDPKVLRSIMEVNFFGATEITRWIAPKMVERKSGQIAVVTSVSGLFGFHLRTAYSASKHALHGFFESLALELRPHGVYVSMIAPGRVKTDISKNALTQDGTKHGQMDPGQEKGIPVDECAHKIIQGLKKKKPLIVVARAERILWWIKKLSTRWFMAVVARVGAK